MAERDLVSVNVDEGFLRHFCSGFLDAYGPSSLFSRALSDRFTLAMANIMDRNSLLENPDSISRLGPLEAVDTLDHLLKNIEGAPEIIWREAMGQLRIGSFQTLADRSFGVGFFSGWLEAFQSGDYKAARALEDEAADKRAT